MLGDLNEWFKELEDELMTEEEKMATQFKILHDSFMNVGYDFDEAMIIVLGLIVLLMGDDE